MRRSFGWRQSDIHNNIINGVVNYGKILHIEAIFKYRENQTTGNRSFLH